MPWTPARRASTSPRMTRGDSGASGTGVRTPAPGTVDPLATTLHRNLVAIATADLATATAPPEAGSPADVRRGPLVLTRRIAPSNVTSTVPSVSVR